MREEIQKAWDAAQTTEEKKSVLKKYGNELTQDELEAFCGKKLTKENMEMIAGGKSKDGHGAFYCCAWQ